jgi:hypothetical protein
MTTSLPHSATVPTEPANNAIRRTGVITDIIWPGQVEINLGGDTSQKIEATCVRDLKPIIGDTVLVISVAGDHIVAGSLNNDDDGTGPHGQIPALVMQAHKTGTQVLPDVTWVESGVSFVDFGNAYPNRSLTLNASGHIVVPAYGVYIIQVHVTFPGVAWTSIRLCVDDEGGGSGGPPNGTPPTMRYAAPATTGATTPTLSSEPAPLFCDVGATFSPYILQVSGGSRTVAAGGVVMTGYRVG